MLVLMVATKIGFNASALLAVGLALHYALGIADRSRTRATLRSAAIASGAVAAFAAARIALLNAQLGEGLTDALDPGLLEWSWSSLGAASSLVLAGAGLVVVAWLMRSRILAGLGALGMAAAFSLTGHVSGIEDGFGLEILLPMHVLIAGFWIAAPLTLWPSREADGLQLTNQLQRFSLFATLSVPILFVAGILLALQLAGGLAGLVATPYGQLLLVKLAATLAALAAGAVNRQIVTHRMETDPDTAKQWLKRTLAVETTAFAIAIAAVSLATTVWPPAPA